MGFFVGCPLNTYLIGRAICLVLENTEWHFARFGKGYKPIVLTKLSR